jgi:capsid portal protein
MVILVGGGALTKASMKRLEDTIRDRVRGRENFHSVLVLEARQTETAGSPSTNAAPRIEMKPLTDAQLKDAMFMGYDDANVTKVRSSFRVPPILVGRSDDYTRATAGASVAAAEEQVFRPERVEFDYKVNRWLLPELKAQYYEFCSLGPNVTDNADLIASLGAGEAAGSMTPNIGRALLSDIFETELPKIEEEWGDLPFTLTLTQLNTAAMAAISEAAPEDEPGAMDDMPDDMEPGDQAGGEPGEGDQQGQPAEGAPPEKTLWRKYARRMPHGFRRAVLEAFHAQIRAELQRRMLKRREALKQLERSARRT